MDDTEYDIIEEFGTSDFLYFYFVKKNNKWGVLDIDYDPIIPCIYSEKPILCHFEEQFKSDHNNLHASKNTVLFYPDFYAYEMVFKTKNEEHKYGYYLIYKQLMPESTLKQYFSECLFDDIRYDSSTNLVHYSNNGNSQCKPLSDVYNMLN